MCGGADAEEPSERGCFLHFVPCSFTQRLSLPRWRDNDVGRRLSPPPRQLNEPTPSAATLRNRAGI